MFGFNNGQPFQPFCGCWFILPNAFEKRYLTQVKLESHTTILATTSRTILHQTFVNPLNETLRDVSYTFPLYDGVTVAAFKCTVAGRVIVGLVKERNQARADYQQAISRGQTAGLLEQNIDAADVFTTSIGNVPAGEELRVEITYLGELKNDAETDGARFTIPTQIAPRYGSMSADTNSGISAHASAGMKITVDVALQQGASIRGIQSPSHPIAVTMGRTSTMMEDDDTFENNLGSSTLALGSTELDKDFVVVIQAKGQDTPRALLETHPTLANQRALMATLVPKFNLPSGHPEIVFVVDRSGSMGGKMHLVIEAMKVFLKSLPVSVKFNICSFGSHHSFLFKKSTTYDAASLQTAIDHLNPSTFGANYGGTEMLRPVKAVLDQRYKDLPLEVMLLTDGEIWNQDTLFEVVNKASVKNARFFTLGIGSSASSSLVEGIARAGRGFSQWVNEGERIDKKLVRMLKGALTPHIKYNLEVKYAAPLGSDEDDFEIIESFEKSMKLVSVESIAASNKIQGGPSKQGKKKISLFNTDTKDEPTNPPAGRYDHLPTISVPNVLQLPHQLPELYPHSRTTVYLLLGPDAPPSVPTSVVLRGASEHGDLELEIPVQDIGNDDTIHKLAAKKAMQDLEEGRGWLSEAHAAGGKTLKSKNEGTWDLIVEREAVRLGTTFQVGGKFCSFVAIDESDQDKDSVRGEALKSPLQQHQESLMILEQQNKNRKLMSRSAAPQAKHMRTASSSTAPGFGGHALMSSANVQPSGFFGPNSVSMHNAPPSTGGGLFGSSGGGFASTAARPAMAPALAPTGVQCDEATLKQYAQEMQSAASMPLPDEDDTDLGSAAIPKASNQQVPRTLFGSASFGSKRQSTSSQTRGASTLSNKAFGVIGAPQGHFTPMAYHGPPVNSPFTGFGTAPIPRGGETTSYRERKIDNTRAHSAGSADVLQNFDFDAFFGGPADGADNGATDVKREAVLVRTNNLAPLEKMQKLIDLQTFSGSWTITHGLLAIISHGAVTPFKSVADIAHAVGSEGVAASHDAMATALAIAWLEVVMNDEQEVWEMVVEKAKGWLGSTMDGNDTVEKMIEGCKGLWKV